jgi:hypothetical protein
MTAKHPSEEQLVMYLFGDAEEPEAIREHLRACEACAAQYAAIEHTLEAVDVAPVPERDADYEARVWQRLRPQLEEKRGFDWGASLGFARDKWFRPQRLAGVGAVAVMLLAAFLAGRYWPKPATGTANNGASTEQIRERLLIVAVGDHLEQSKMMLVELVNAGPEKSVDISAEQHRADELVATNRLYRLTAQREGDMAVASVLDELERTLLEIAHGPSQLSAADLDSLQKRIEAQGLLFKVRVVGSQLREREKTLAQASPRGIS